MSLQPAFKITTSQIINVIIITLIASVASATTIFVVSRVLSSQKTEENLSAISHDSTITHNTVSSLGRLSPKGEVINLSAPAFMEGARVDKLLVKLGDRVKPGQVVAILDSYERLKAGLERSQKQVIVAQTHLMQVKAGAKAGTINAQAATVERLKAELTGQIAAQQATIERLDTEWDNAKTECKRYASIYEDGAISADERDNKCLKEKTIAKQLKEAKVNLNRTEETISQQLTEAKATLEQIAEVRPTDIAAATAELEAAKADVAQAQANLNLAYVRSPQSGQILKIRTFPGELISNRGIVEIGQTRQMYAIAEIYETDISQVKLGQKATITSKGFTGELQGVVDEIGLQIGKKDVLGTDPAADIDARVVEVKIRLNPGDSQKVIGLTNLQINVVINTTDK